MQPPGVPARFDKYEFEQVFPLLEDLGGDMVILVTAGPHRGRVVDLNHEGGSFDQAVLGTTLQEFLDTWIGLSLGGLLRHRGATALSGRRRGPAVEKPAVEKITVAEVET
ncbi:MAG TPA: hypothetical protein VLT87_26575 [Thermoanaerobaculia bacterium]|nr:hypothetical protein [Thermoanaerobaculia bacterium]